MSKVETLYLKFIDGNKRRVDVYQPNDYNTSKKYKVIYFHDGQNIFFDSEATYGTSWKIKDICDEHSYPFIIVGIYNGNEERLNEYAPFLVDADPKEAKKYNWTKALGQLYASWIVETLKPYIDSHYSTLSDFSSTAICGSSMGGVMSSFMGAKYSNVFKYVGVFSLASWYNEKEHLNYIAQSKPNLNQCYFVYVGTEENSIPFYEGMNKIYLSCTSSYLHTLEKLGFDNEHLMFVLGQGEEHNEASWSHHINNFLKLVNKISR